MSTLLVILGYMAFGALLLAFIHMGYRDGKREGRREMSNRWFDSLADCDEIVPRSLWDDYMERKNP